MIDTGDRTGFRAGKILLGLLAALSVVFILSGGFFYVWIVADYLEDDSPFVGLQMLGWIFGLFSAGVISIGLLLAGVLFRLISRHRASLGLAIAAIAFMIVTYLVFSNISESDSTELMILQGSCILYLFLIALPPFLHWLKAKLEPSAASPKHH